MSAVRSTRLESEGIIERYTAVLNASKIGVGLTVFARISLISQDAESVEQFATTIRKLPQVVEAHIMAGECDALLRVVAADLDSYRQFQSTHLTRKNGVQTVKTDIPMQRIKLSSELPVCVHLSLGSCARRSGDGGPRLRSRRVALA
jgi:Lrp/AsnC family transcriptional regulator, repressor for azl operon